jgi:CRISPR-associated protein Cas1
MTDRLIDISEGPARLKIRNELLVIEREGCDDYTVPLPELGVLVVSNPQVSYTQAVLSGIAAAGGAFVACDEKHTPVGMLLPLKAHFVQAERFGKQIEASLPTCKRLWQQLIEAKILAQGRLLKEFRGADEGLALMAEKVRSGDPDNIEGLASRRYWPALFNDRKFRRNRDAPDQNRHLNYGYAILRAIISRGICAAGLHPSIGLHHHNRYDAFRLASDLMEPFRPIVDKAVVKWIESHDPLATIDSQTKAALLAPLTGRFEIEGESRTLFDIASRTAASLAGVFMGKEKSLSLPEI